MGLLLCTKAAQRAFYYEKLDVNLWSLQELAYVLVRYPVIIPERFVDRKLTNWLRTELGQETLAGKLEQYLNVEDTDHQARLLMMILKEANYHKDSEIAAFEAEYRKLKNVEPHQFQTMLGDAYFRMERYGKAMEAYEEAIRTGGDVNVSMKLGCTYVTVMQYDKASDIFEEIFVETNHDEPLKRLYFISRLEPSVDTIEKYRENIPEETFADWEAQYQAAYRKVEQSERMQSVSEIYKKDKAEFRTQAKLMLVKWKKEYRDRI